MNKYTKDQGQQEGNADTCPLEALSRVGLVCSYPRALAWFPSIRHALSLFDIIQLPWKAGLLSEMILSLSSIRN